MNWIKWTAALAALVFLVSCTSKEVQTFTQVGLIAAGEDEEKAKEISEAVGKGVGALGPVPFEQERSIGGGIAVDSFARKGELHPNEGLQRYVNLVGSAVVRESERKGFPFAFAVVDSGEVNAWAAPGGYIFITSGALREMEDEAMLAGVLAHEVFHVTEGHMLKMMKRQQFFDAALQGLKATTDEDVESYSKFVDAGSELLFEKGLDRSMEIDSDLAGVELAVMAGYDPTGLLRYLRKLDQGTAGTGGGWFSSTHPSLRERANALETKINAEMQGLEGPRVEDRFRRMVGDALAP